MWNILIVINRQLQLQFIDSICPAYHLLQETNLYSGIDIYGRV